MTNRLTVPGGSCRTVMVIYGTRPEAVKLAPVIRALAASPNYEPTVVVTGQHREMLDQVNTLFGIRPDIDLNILQQRQTLAGVTTRSLGGLDAAIQHAAPDMVIVQGDTTTTFAASLAACYHQVPVTHVEAGLRTADRLSPFPEEINRRLTAQLANLHLAPTAGSRANLLAENIDPATVVVTGNTVIDALLWVVGRPAPRLDPAVEMLRDDPRRVLLVTAHRRESWGRPMAEAAQALAELAAARPDLLVVFPLHRNPTVRDAVRPALAGLPNVMLTEPMDYASFAHLMNRATLVITDSGGVQEEAPSLGRPVLVLRTNTERPEAVHAGTVQLVGTDRTRIVAAVERLLDDEIAYKAMATAVNPYGDGRAAQRTIAALDHYFDLGPPAEEFLDPVTDAAPDPAAPTVPAARVARVPAA